MRFLVKVTLRHSANLPLESARINAGTVGLGRGLINAQPQSDGRKLDEGEVIRRELVVARCDPPTLFDLVEESLDQIAGAIEVGAEADRLRPVPSWRNVCPCTVLAQMS